MVYSPHFQNLHGPGKSNNRNPHGIALNHGPQHFWSRDQFIGRHFFHGWVAGMVSGWFSHIKFIVHFISIIITSVIPPNHQALDPRGWGSLERLNKTSELLNKICSILLYRVMYFHDWKSRSDLEFLDHLVLNVHSPWPPLLSSHHHLHLVLWVPCGIWHMWAP